MSKKFLAGLLLILSACASAPDPDAEALEFITPLTLEPPPIYSLLGYRDQLRLESQQVSALDSIAQSNRDVNAPLIDSLRAVGREQGGRYSGMMAIDSATQPLLERIRENNRQAVARVGEVLTPEQQATACRLFNEAPDRRRQAQQDAGRRPPRRGRGTAEDSISGGVGARVWTWCGGGAVTQPRSGGS